MGTSTTVSLGLPRAPTPDASSGAPYVCNQNHRAHSGRVAIQGILVRHAEKIRLLETYHILMHILEVSLQLVRLGKRGITLRAFELPIGVRALEGQLSRGGTHGPIALTEQEVASFHYI